MRHRMDRCTEQNGFKKGAIGTDQSARVVENSGGIIPVESRTVCRLDRGEDSAVDRQQVGACRHGLQKIADGIANADFWSMAIGSWTLQIIKRSDQAQGFEVLPRRWVVERTFAWLGRCRRLAKDFEKTIQSAEAWILVANIRLLTRRIARYCYPS